MSPACANFSHDATIWRAACASDAQIGRSSSAADR
jgi:hypothetical protein